MRQGALHLSFSAKGEYYVVCTIVVLHSGKVSGCKVYV